MLFYHMTVVQTLYAVCEDIHWVKDHGKDDYTTILWLEIVFTAKCFKTTLIICGMVYKRHREITT